MNKRTITLLVLLSDLMGFSLSVCRWSMAMRVCLIGTIYFPLRNIPPVSASDDEAATFFSVWQTVMMRPFIFGLGMLVVGG